MTKFLAFVFSVLLLVGCTSGTAVDPWTTDSKGIRYQIIEDSLGTLSPKTGDKIGFDLQILFQGDSLIYDSKKRGQTLEFILSEKMFSGSFSEALPMLTVGDSCILEMLTEHFYPDGMPRGLAKGDTILCGIRLLEIEAR